MLCKPSLLFLFLSLMLPAASFGAVGTKSLCPEQIETIQSVKHVPEGWSAVIDWQPSRLINAGFYDGHPDQQAELAPSEVKATKRQVKNTWKFSASHNDSLWIKCIYSDTGLSLVKQLGENISTCTTSYDNRFSPALLVSVNCE